MSDNTLKTFLGRSLNRLTEKRVADAQALLGRSWPCTVKSVFGNTNTIVTVSFNITTPFTLSPITIPVAGWEYLRFPIQVGDQGFTIGADALLGPVVGLGSGTPSSSIPPASLQGLVFLPLGNNKWSATDDANKVVLYGPNGVVLRDKVNENSVVVQQSDGSVTITAKTTLKLQVGGKNITITSSGVSIEGKEFLTHEHSGIQAGSSNSGPVV